MSSWPSACCCVMAPLTATEAAAVKALLESKRGNRTLVPTSVDLLTDYLSHPGRRARRWTLEVVQRVYGSTIRVVAQSLGVWCW